MYGDIVTFDDSIDVADEFVEVVCYNSSKDELYRNYHAQFVKHGVPKDSKRTHTRERRR